jgi:hypothetical protein
VLPLDAVVGFVLPEAAANGLIEAASFILKTAVGRPF